MLKTLVSLGVLIYFMLLCNNGVFGEDIKFLERITVDTNAKFKDTPKSFCVTEDGVFLLPDAQNGTIKVFSFSQRGKSITLINSFGRDRSAGAENLGEPWYCTYSQELSRFAVMDYGLVRQVVIFDRKGKADFTFKQTVPCKQLGCGIKFSGDGNQIIVSGFEMDNNNLPCDLYAIDAVSMEKKYLLPSHEKYGLKSYGEFIYEYQIKETLPAIGIKSFIDIKGTDLFLVWEGALRVIKVDLASNSNARTTFERKTSYYSRPDSAKLSTSYKQRDFVTYRKDRANMAYITNIFATSSHIFLVYHTARKFENSDKIFRLQVYNLKGDLQSDVRITENPGSSMWLDKGSDELYALSDDSPIGKGKFDILKYKIFTK